MKKHHGTLILGLAIAICLTACKGPSENAAVPEGNQQQETTAAEEKTDLKDGSDIKFAIVFSGAGLGDNAYNDEVYQGCEMAVEEFGCSFDYCETREVAETETQLRSYADAGEYDIIFTISTDQVDTLKMVAEDYPDQKFCMLDTVIEGYDNIHCIAAAYPDQHFLSGMLAGIATQDERFPLSNPENILGFCIAVDSPTSRGQAAGFLAGAKYANPDVEILTNYIGGYNDPAKAKELALLMYQRGADIVGANAGSSTQGVFYAAQEENRYVVGTALGMVDPDHSLSTSLKKVWLFVVEEIRQIKDGTWKPGYTTMGIPEGVCDYECDGLNLEIPEDVIQKLDEAKKAISEGTLILPQDIDEIDAWAEKNTMPQ
ncbi:MAG: BMP family ABC transporter substrate-binding protein [Lachnospiraceae bacterium]|nr:BMP family ABC transporter substrate-binding protein [Lachnospiraceae bacterium]